MGYAAYPSNRAAMNVCERSATPAQILVEDAGMSLFGAPDTA
jgi:hypothetical protein